MKVIDDDSGDDPHILGTHRLNVKNNTKIITGIYREMVVRFINLTGRDISSDIKPI